MFPGDACVLPQLAEIKTPRPMDVASEPLVYDEYMLILSIIEHAQDNLLRMT
jgi:hypothetical protein